MAKLFLSSDEMRITLKYPHRITICGLILQGVVIVFLWHTARYFQYFGQWWRVVFSKKPGFKIYFKGAAFILLLAIGHARLHILKTFHIITPDLVEVTSLSILFPVNLF